MSLININKLSFSYDTHHDLIFDNVSLQLQTSWKIGLIGRNGQGKTTLLNLLRGKLRYSGKINSMVNFDFFPYEIIDKTMITLDIVYKINSNIEIWQLEKELSFLAIDISCLLRPYNTLSNGEQTKVMLATLFLNQNNFLLIDEPTNHLDLETRQLVSKYLKNKKGFILVSHDRVFLDDCIDHVLCINKSSIDLQRGNYSSWNQNRLNHEKNEQTISDKLHKEINHLTKAAKKTEMWSKNIEASKLGNASEGTKPFDKGFIGHKSAKMMKRSKSAQKRYEKAIESNEKLLKDYEKTEYLKITSLKHHSNVLVNIKGVSIYYDDIKAINNLSFSIKQGDRIAILGRNGSGKSSLLKLLIGNSLKYDGQVDCVSNLSISYVSQDTSTLSGDLSDYIKSYNIDEAQFKSILRKLGFSRNQFSKDIIEYSSGQKKKVLIARSLCERAHLYVWDEPLNYLDIISRLQIEELLLEYKPTIIFVEHDKKFVDNIATTLVTL